MVNDDDDVQQQQQQQQQQHLRCRIKIQCQYEIYNELDETIIKTTNIFDASNASEVRVGLPVGVKSKKSQPGDETYSGMHDQGPLPDLKEGGPLTLLTGCTKIAKEYNDEFLTQCIKEENENNKPDQPNKRSKQQ